ncbi:MAG: uracil-DNA glycosylase [Bacteroidales bacterium]|jgi:uracil-DNA glycosylase|nr:uracil-DNA glycosylase [Bacteroidales bacterium]
MENENIKIDSLWNDILNSESKKEYFAKLTESLIQEKSKYKIFPNKGMIFNAFKFTPFDCVKVVLLGQDPYHGIGQAHGLSFSVPPEIKPPPSLQNIYKELNADIGFQIPNHGNLTAWTKQGIFLLNSILTVRENCPGSHHNFGWEIFTDNIIEILSKQKNHLVFLLWGKYAQTKESLIDTDKHLILKTAHPSPFSANNGFFGCKHFSKTNDYLKQNGIPEIDFKIENYSENSLF